jgi:hypothetical protein
LAHQISGLGAIQRTRAVAAASDVFDVVTDAHAAIVSQAR